MTKVPGSCCSLAYNMKTVEAKVIILEYKDFIIKRHLYLTAHTNRLVSCAYH